MDAFNVPKKVNRHVLKALNTLCDGNINKSVPKSLILDQVKFQMRNLVPVPNIDTAIQKSLKNLSKIGLIERTGPEKFAITRPYDAPPPQPPQSKSPKRKFFRNDTNKNKKSRGPVNPNVNRAYLSDESLSGDEYDRSRKRLRTNTKKMKHSGRNTELPKARENYLHLSNSQRYDADDIYLTSSGSSIMEYVSGSRTSTKADIGSTASIEIIETDPRSETPKPVENNSRNDNAPPVKSQLKIIEIYHKRNKSNDKIQNSETTPSSLTESPSDVSKHSVKQSKETLNVNNNTDDVRAEHSKSMVASESKTLEPSNTS